MLTPSPAGCSPRPSIVWAAPPGPGCGSSHCCTGFGSSRSRRSWWWGVGPAGSFWWPGRGAQSSETPGTSSPMRSAPTCGEGRTGWREGEGKRENEVENMLTCVNIINSEYDILTWLKGCCWRASACSRSPAVKGTCWGLRSPCIRSPCTAGRTTRTRTAAGWCWGRSDETWSLFPSGSHSWPTDKTDGGRGEDTLSGLARHFHLRYFVLDWLVFITQMDKKLISYSVY